MEQRSKKWPEMTKNYVCASTPYLCCIHHKIVFFCCTSLKWWHLHMFFHFFKVLVLWVVRGEGIKKGKKWSKTTKKFSLTLYLSTCTSYDCDFWYTCVEWWHLQQSFSFFRKSDFSDFSKFINKCQKEILRCAPFSSHACDFFVRLWLILPQ